MIVPFKHFPMEINHSDVEEHEPNLTWSVRLSVIFQVFQFTAHNPDTMVFGMDYEGDF